jgi:superfamily II DNA or RNA helicase
MPTQNSSQPAVPVIEIEQRENRIVVTCPNRVILENLLDFLTFKRRVTKTIRSGRYANMKFVYQKEPCYQRTNLWNAITCPAGFQHMIIEEFGKMCDFRVLTSPVPRLIKNCVPDWSRLDPNVKFRSNQREILEKMLAADRGRIIVPTAVGKSFLIQQYVSLLPKARILVSTYSTQVLKQLHQDLNKMLCGRVGIWCGDTKKMPDARVVCVSQGLLNNYLPAKGEQNVDVTIIDEMHEWGSEKRLEILSNVRYAKMFGLSANKTRPDKADFRLNGLFGPVLAEMNYDEAVERDLITPIWIVWVPVRSNQDPVAHLGSTDGEGKSSFWQCAAREKFGVWRYALRNKAIANAARLFNEDDQILITVKTIEHALYLHKLLPEFTVVYAPKDYKQLLRFRRKNLLEGVPRMTKERLDFLKHSFSEGTLKKAIATGVWSRGVNFPQLSVLIRADASDSTIADTQLPGRAARKHEDKTVSLVFDFTDEYNPTLLDKASARRKRYKAHGWKQITLSELQRLMSQ